MMSVPSSTEFLIRYPEFGEQPTSLINTIISEAAIQTPEDVWGLLQFQAVTHLTAHLLALRIMQVGQQIGMQTGNPFGDGLKATVYGQSYEQLSRSLPLTGFAF